MAATVYGNVSHGFASAETGLYVASLDFDIKHPVKYVPDHQGQDVGGAFYNPSATFSMSGVERTDESISAKTAAAITLANAVDFADYITGYTSGGATFVTGIKPTLKNDDFKMLDMSGDFKPFISAA